MEAAQKEIVAAMLAEVQVAILVTQGDQWPTATMQAFAETPDLDLLFIMRFSSEKFENLIKRPKVTVLVDTLKNQVIVPTTAIRHGPQGDFVYVLQTDSTVKVRQVKSGPSTGESTSIASGLAAGETVITEGGDRLRDGAAVTLPKPHSSGASNSAAAGAGAGVFGGM